MQERITHASAMEELALVPSGAGESTIVEHHAELPIAEHNFARKKLLELDRGIRSLLFSGCKVISLGGSC